MKKKSLFYIACVLILTALAFGFVPEQTFRGKMVGAVDFEKYLGMSHETLEWNGNHPDDKTAWTGTAFSGMPTIMMTGNSENDWLKPVFEFLSQKRFRPASTLLLSLLGAFLLMLVLGINPILALGGAVAVTFCSYNMQIIQSGHNTKMLALAFAPWLLAGIIFTYRKALDPAAEGWKKWLPSALLGAVLSGFAMAFQVKANHVQITWYLGVIVALYALGLIVWICSSKERLSRLWARFLAASGMLVVAGGLGIATSACDLVPTWEYTTQTTRAGSELSGGSSEGLDLDYSTAFSYGWEELPNLMIPNFNGGATKGALPRNSKTEELIKASNVSNRRQAVREQPLYWGPQPGTAGPMYIGAISVFLFILGLFLCDGKDKWWMLAAAILSIGLALGSNIMPLTRFFHDYVPFYNKFRAVSTSLVMLQFVMPMLGFLALDRILKGGVEKKDLIKKGLVAFALTGGICLIFSVFPGLAGDFRGSVDPSLSDVHVKALVQDRKTLLRNDAFVSFLLIAATYLLLLWSVGKKASSRTRNLVAMAVCLLVTVNLFGVGKRYLNSDHFKKWNDFNKDNFSERPVDQILKGDESPSFRVVDLSVDAFNEARTSYFHKSIGGYSAAKLGRYQDLIENRLKDELNGIRQTMLQNEKLSDFNENLAPIPALSMLNTKYFIVDGNWQPVFNPQAMGNAWFVRSAVVAASPDEELDLVGKADLHNSAILGQDFKDVFVPPAAGENDWIEMSSYAPNELHYVYNASKPRAVIFSEIYYPYGWKARLDDGTSLDLFRADWTLRGTIVPAGSHEIVMRMEPSSYKVGARISLFASATIFTLLLLALCGMVVFTMKRNNKRTGALVLFALPLLVISSCAGGRMMDRLSDIESYINDRPDSALTAIRAIDTLDLKTRAEKAKYSLLHAMALDKNYIDTADTRIIQPAVDYYERHGSPEERLKVYMYMGTLYHNAKDYRQAVYSFKKAEESTSDVSDKNLIGVLYSKIAETFTMTEEYAQAEEYIDKSINCFSECGRKDQENLEKHIKARMLIRQKNWDAANDYLLSLMSDTTFSSRIAGAIEADYAMYILYDQRKDDTLALDHFRKAIAINRGLENYDYYYAYAYSLGIAGLFNEETELLAALPHQSPPEKFSFDYWRHRQQRANGDFRAAYNSLWSAKEYSDSIFRESIIKSATIAQKSFFENKIKEQEIIDQRHTSIIIILMILLTVFVVFGYLYICWRRRLHEQENGRKDLIIDSLKDELCHLQVEYDNSHERRLTRTQFHFKYLSQLFEGLNVLERNGGVLSAEKLYQLINGQIKLLDKDSDAQKEFETVLNLDTDGIMEGFRKDFPKLKEEEYRLASLIFAGFDNTIITLVMDVSTTENTRVKKSRLKKRIKDSDVSRRERYLRFFE